MSSLHRIGWKGNFPFFIHCYKNASVLDYCTNGRLTILADYSQPNTIEFWPHKQSWRVNMRKRVSIWLEQLCLVTRNRRATCLMTYIWAHMNMCSQLYLFCLPVWHYSTLYVDWNYCHLITLSHLTTFGMYFMLALCSVELGTIQYVSAPNA